MERGVKALVRILVLASLLGVLVILFHPAYRQTWQALWRDEAEWSPIWQSNLLYYREVTYQAPEAHDPAK